MNGLASRWVAAISLVLLTVPFAFSNDKGFDIRFLAGPQGFTQSKIKLLFEGTNLVLAGKAGKKRQSYSIPLPQVTFMSHSPVRFNRASQVARNVPDANYPDLGRCSGLGCAANALVFLTWATYETGRATAIGVSATQHGKQHFITIDWSDEGVEYELQFEASKDDYSTLIKQLEAASGKKLLDFEERWTQVQEELKRETDHAVPVVLSKRVKVEDLSLAPGKYSIIALPREKDLAEIYFFEGTLIDSTSLRGVAVVSTGAAVDTSLKETEVDYTATTPAQIQEIRTPTRTFRMVVTSAMQK